MKHINTPLLRMPQKPSSTWSRNCCHSSGTMPNPSPILCAVMGLTRRTSHDTHASITIRPSTFIFSTHCSYFSLKPGIVGHRFSPQSGSDFSTRQMKSIASWISTLPLVTFSFNRVYPNNRTQRGQCGLCMLHIREELTSNIVVIQQ